MCIEVCESARADSEIGQLPLFSAGVHACCVHWPGPLRVAHTPLDKGINNSSCVLSNKSPLPSDFPLIGGEEIIAYSNILAIF